MCGSLRHVHLAQNSGNGLSIKQAYEVIALYLIGAVVSLAACLQGVSATLLIANGLLLV